MEGRVPVGHVQRILFASNLFVHRYTGGGGEYILRHRWNLYVEENFSHISFSFPFLPIISFLGIRLDGMMIGCLYTFPPKGLGLNLPLTSVITFFSLLYRRRDINTTTIIVSLFPSPCFLSLGVKKS